MSEISALLKQRSDAEQFVARRDMALKLAEVPEFKQLVLKEFCVEECARYAQASADPALKADAREDSLAIAQAAGHFRRWFSVIVQMGNQAERQIPEIDNALEEARSEGGDQ